MSVTIATLEFEHRRGQPLQLPLPDLRNDARAGLDGIAISDEGLRPYPTRWELTSYHDDAATAVAQHEALAALAGVDSVSVTDEFEVTTTDVIVRAVQPLDMRFVIRDGDTKVRLILLVMLEVQVS